MIVIAAFAWYSSARTSQAATKYSLATVTKNTIVTTIDGTGQVSGDQQLDVKPKVGSTVTKIAVKVGDQIKAGDILAVLDKTDALKTVRDASQSVRDAQVSLTTSKLQLEKTKQPSDPVAVMQAEDALAKAKRDLEDLKSGPTSYDLQQAQADVDVAANNIKMSADGTMPQTVRDAYDEYVLILQSAIQTLETSRVDADGILGVDSPITKNGLSQAFSILNDTYKFNSRYSYDIVKQSNSTSKLAVDALEIKNENTDDIKSAVTLVSTALNNMSTLLSDLTDGLQASIANSSFTQNDLDGLKTTINSDRTNVNTKITSLVNQDQAVQQAYNSFQNAQISYQKAVNTLNELKAGASASDIASAEEKVKEAQAQLDKLRAGADPLDVKLSQIAVDQKVSALTSAQNKLSDANGALNDYTIIAPFDGVIGKISVQKGVDVSAGTAMFTMLTHKKIATISLNEVDVAKVAVGQKATLTFDAIEALSLTGEVAEVSPLGVVSQGVVTYEVKVAFDSQDERIKSGMSASVSIVTEVHADVLTVPNAAIKVQGEQNYVQTLDESVKAGSDGLYETEQAPGRLIVEVGASDDTVTEIKSGLKEGDEIIVQTIKTTASQTSATSNQSTGSLLPVGGATRAAGGGGNAQFIGR